MEVYKQYGIDFEVGNRNDSFFRLASWMKNRSILTDKAENELWRIYDSIDSTDFPQTELETVIKNVFELAKERKDHS